jgi:hypothetical protein
MFVPGYLGLKELVVTALMKKGSIRLGYKVNVSKGSAGDRQCMKDGKADV